MAFRVARTGDSQRFHLHFPHQAAKRRRFQGCKCMDSKRVPVLEFNCATMKEELKTYRFTLPVSVQVWTKAILGGQEGHDAL